jgi:hypothetical protein
MARLGLEGSIMSVSAIAAVGVQAAVRYAPVAPVAKVKAVKRGLVAKGAEKGEIGAPTALAPRLGRSRSPAASSSSAVQAALNDLQFGG